MKIAYLCDKQHFLKKMSRVRFHSMEAIEKMLTNKNFLWTGPNWENFDNNKTVDENLINNGFTPDVIVGYKPLERAAAPKAADLPPSMGEASVSPSESSAPSKPSL